MNFTADTRVYVAGCGGMLGDAVYQLFSSIAQVEATDVAVSEPWLKFGDVRDYHGIRDSIMRFRPDVIINLAALTDLEQCEREPENAWLTNALGAENLGLIANELDVPYVFISTAGVFDGELDSYHDFDSPRPLGVYGRSKHHAELFIAQHVRRFFVARAGWMMGGGPKKDKKFINKIYRQLCDGRNELFVVDDKVGTPTYTVDFARGLLQLLRSDIYGLYNHGGEGRCSRFDVAREFLQLLSLSSSVKLTRVDSSYFAADYFAARPVSEALVNLKLRARGFAPMRDWKVCVAEYAQVFVRDFASRSKT